MSATSKRKVSWWVLFALLFIQVKVAMGGCLISDVLPHVQMKMSGASCTEHSQPSSQLCMKHCAQNSDALKLTLDLPVFSPAIFSSGVSLLAEEDIADFETHGHFTATSGPPPYLRFLRLLN